MDAVTSRANTDYQTNDYPTNNQRTAPVTDVVIIAENLGKHYTIGHQAENGRDVALRDVLVNNARRQRRGKPRQCQRRDAETQSFPYSPFAICHSLFYQPDARQAPHPGQRA